MLKIRYVVAIVAAINLVKYFIAINLLDSSNFLDFDYKYYYKPAADNYNNIYLNNNQIFDDLSSKVTPIFPLFLRFFGNTSIFLLLYLILYALILVMIYKICTKLHSRKVAIVAVVFLSIEPSLYISSISLSPELLFTFVLVLALYFMICQPMPNSNGNMFIFSSLIGLSVLIRPIALLAIIALTGLLLVKFILTLDKMYIYLVFIITSFGMLWSIRNFITHDVFNISTISSNNILWYEGVPAMAEAKDLSFEEAKLIESDRRVLELGINPTVSELYSYNSNRGIALIKEYPIGWIQSHIDGIGKILFGVYKSKYKIINEEVFGLNSNLLNNFHFICLGLITLAIWFFFIFGIRVIVQLDFNSALVLFILVISIIVPATGQIAYARFRVPTVPFICIVAALGLNKLWSERNFLRSLNREK